jgi:hypothetical protein
MPLCPAGFVSRPSSLLRIPVVRASIRIQRTAQPVRLNAVPQPLETAQGPCFVDEARRIECPRGISQGRKQIPLTAGHPFMGRAVLMEQHAGQGLAGPLRAMRPAPGRSRPRSCGVQPVLRPRIGARPAMLVVPPLVERLHRPARVAALVHHHPLQRVIHRDRPSRGPAADLLPPPPRRPRSGRSTDGLSAPCPPNLRRLPHRPISPLSSRIHLLQSHLSHLLEDGCPCPRGPS